jgi:hypothetical protein
MMHVDGWQREFDDPIPPPRGRQLVTLQDVASYIMKLPKAEQNLGVWQTAISCLIGAARRPRLHDACADRDAAGDQLARRTRVRLVAEGQTLGTPQAGTGLMKKVWT